MKTTALLLSTLVVAYAVPAFSVPQPKAAPINSSQKRSAPQNEIDESDNAQAVQQIAKRITVRITSENNNNGGSGVLISKKGNNYLVLTNAHVTKRSTKFQIQAFNSKSKQYTQYAARPIDGGFDSKYDLALLEFTSENTYKPADLAEMGTPLEENATGIYSSGFAFDEQNIRVTKGRVAQLPDIPFDDGTQIGYSIDKKGIRQGMSGGAILDGQGRLLGINTVSDRPIVPSYTYEDGSKPLPKWAEKYSRVNWGVPVYNFLKKVKPDILYGYDNLPQVEHQATPTKYLAGMNNKARRMTVRIEAGGGNGSGVVIAQKGDSYYVLTAKHVVQPEPTQENPQPKTFADNKITITTFDQDSHKATGTVVAKGADLAVVKFSSTNKYRLARLGNYNQGVSAWAFVGGFPGRETISSPLWV